MAGMQSPISSMCTNAPSVSATNYIAPVTDGSLGNWTATRTQAEMVIGAAGTIDYLRVQVATNPGAGASGKKYDFTLWKNGSAQSLTTQILETAVKNADTTHSFAVAAGDLLALESVPANSPSATGVITWVFRFTSAVDGVSVWMSSSDTNQQAANTTIYYTLIGSAIGNATSSNRGIYMPCGGTISDLYIESDADPGGVAQSYAAQLGVNGTFSAAFPHCSIASGSTAANDTGHTAAVVQGDLIQLQCISSLIAAAARIRFSFKFIATVNGESVGAANILGTLGQNTTSYRSVCGGQSTFNATEMNRQHIMIACAVKKMFVQLTGNVGGSAQTHVNTFRVNAGAATPSLTCSIASGAASNFDNTNAPTIVDDDLIDNQTVNSATTGTLTGSISWVYFITPAATIHIVPILDRHYRAHRI